MTEDITRQLKQIRLDYNCYKIDLKTAEEKASPLIKIINNKALGVANKYNKLAPKISFKKFISS